MTGETLEADGVAICAASGLITVAGLRRLRGGFAASFTRDTHVCLLDFSRCVWALTDAETDAELSQLEPEPHRQLYGVWVHPALNRRAFVLAAWAFANRGIVRLAFTDYVRALDQARDWAQIRASYPRREDGPTRITQ